MRPSQVSGPPLGLAVLFSFICLLVWAPTFIVPVDFPTIQEAIDAVFDDDVIEVQPGTYLENIDFLGKAITVVSTGGPGVTIIDGSACTKGQDFCSVVTFATGEGPDSVLEGFTVTGGEGTAGPFNGILGGGIYCRTANPTILNCTISGNTTTSLGGGVGGGMWNGYSSFPTLSNCTITGNTAGSGGGLWNDDSSPALTNCTISENATSGGGGGMSNYLFSSPILTDCMLVGNTAYTYGGGMWNDFSLPSLIGCTISGNTADQGGGMWNGYSSYPSLIGCTISGNTAGLGGGMWSNFASPSLIDCTISGNTAYYEGGGVRNFYASSASLTNCTISGNTADTGGGMWNTSSTLALTNCTISENLASSGGGMWNNSSDATLKNCTITGNAADFGGGIWNGSSSPTLINCTISGNTAGNSGGGLWNETTGTTGSHPIVANSIAWGDAPNEIESQADSQAIVTFSDVQGGYPGVGNIDTDPFFVDADGGDFHLLPCSPAVDAGDNTVPNLPPIDFEGDPRIENGVVDMGVDEVLGGPGPGPCPQEPTFVRGDCNDDSLFNIGDPIFLLSELFSGGAPASCDDACDMNDDGLKDIGDAVYALSAQFSGGPLPPAPHPGCGSDHTADGLECGAYTGCP